MTKNESKGALGPWMSLSLVIGTMIGGGIFLLPASLAPLGWNAALGWIISGCGAIALAMTFRLLMDGTGQGLQHNIERVFGEGPSFLALWSYWFAGFPSMAALSIAGATILLGLVAPDVGRTGQLALAIAILWLLVAINCLGTRSAGRFQLASVMIKIIPLLLVIGSAAWLLAGPQESAPLADTPISFDNLSTAVALTLFALLGFEAATVPVGKVRNPRRNITIALIGGTAFVLTLYLLASTGIAIILPWQEVAQSAAPFADATAGSLGAAGVILVSMCIAVSVIGCTNGLMLTSGELTYSMAMRNEVPAPLARVNRHGVASRAVMMAGLITTVMILLNASRGAVELFEFFVLLTAASALPMFFFVLAAVFKESRDFRRILILLPAFGFALFAAYGTGLEPTLWVGVLIAAGWAVRWFSRRTA